MGVKVLSLFDGISCGQLALERANIPVDIYYASEIDKAAIQITQKNYPATIQLGDINNWREWSIDWASIDLLIGGSPCQGFSFAGKQLNFNDSRSKLFFVYVDILNHIRKYNPNIKFLLENVKMKKEYQNVITSYLGVEPVEINSALVSAQNRKRLYWTNIGKIEQPKDKGILLKDIVHENADCDREKSHAIIASIGRTTTREYFKKNQGQLVFESLKEYIVPFDKTLQILEKEVEKGKVGFFRKDSQANRVYFIHDKAVTLCGDAGGGAAKMGQYLFGNIIPASKINNPEFKKSYLQYDVNGLGHGSQDQRACYLNGKHSCLDTGCSNKAKVFFTCLNKQTTHGVLIEGYIRKLTPIECERLQTLPDNYTEGISNSQRYKCLGNGWTVDVIVHIFNSLLINYKEV